MEIQAKGYSHLLLGAAFSLALISAPGCNDGGSPSAQNNPENKTVSRGKKTPVATTCAHPSLEAASETRAAMVSYFSEISTRLDLLSPAEKRALFVDIDAKGRERNRAVAPGSPVAAPWSQKDFQKDGTPGTSTERARAELGLTDSGPPVVVAVVDTGIDINHEALKDHIWTNPTPDSDPRYPGALHGWNFLGNAAGADVDWANLEVTRELRRMQALAKTTTLTDEGQAYLAWLSSFYNNGLKSTQTTLATRQKSLQELIDSLATLTKACGEAVENDAEVKAIQTTDPALLAARTAALKYLDSGHDVAWFNTSIASWQNTLATNYNLDKDPGAIVGDNPDELTQGGYGNPSIVPSNFSDEEHATHVSGIIGGVNVGTAGVTGQATNVRIMSLRAVPNGDERDKDIANAIYFAADHGARIISASFGKDISPHRDYVWKALEYAASKDVLFIQAAANDSKDRDHVEVYPNRLETDSLGVVQETLPNCIVIGASAKTADSKLAADFSDYGQTSVDLFAPGEQIYSSIPGNKYAELDGTSMATPEVSGIAALVLSHYPKLTAVQLKSVLLGTTESFSSLSVVQPSTDPDHPESVLFSTLSATGGIVNALSALKAAARL